MLNNKTAQIGETVTWVIASIIIIATLIVFVYLSSILATTNFLSLSNLKISNEEKSDQIDIKISIAHKLANDKNKKIIDEWIKNENG